MADAKALCLSRGQRHGGKIFNVDVANKSMLASAHINITFLFSLALRFIQAAADTMSHIMHNLTQLMYLSHCLIND